MPAKPTVPHPMYWLAAPLVGDAEALAVVEDEPVAATVPDADVAPAVPFALDVGDEVEFDACSNWPPWIRAGDWV